MTNDSHKKTDKVKSVVRETRLQAEETAELMTFLIAALPSQSRNNIKSLLTHRQVIVDGEVVTQYNHLLEPGQEVLINWALARDKEDNKSINIIYEDAEIIVIDKPAGLLTIATDAEKVHTAYHQPDRLCAINILSTVIYCALGWIGIHQGHAVCQK